MTKSWRIVVITTLIGSAWAFAYFQGGYLAYHIWDTTEILAVLTTVQCFFPLKRVQVDRRLNPDTAVEGDTITVELTLTSRSWWPWAWVAVTESLPKALRADHDPNFVVAFWLKRTATVRYQLTSVPRGRHTLTPPRLTTGDVLGLWKKSRLAESESIPVVIWPQTTGLHHLGRQFRQWSGGALMSRHVYEDATLPLGIRDYITGDRLAQIHWRTTARTGQFKVKQFEPTIRPHMRIVLDTMQAFETDHDWELAIQIAASLVNLADHDSQPMALLWVDEGDQRIGVGEGRAHYENILNYLASLPHFQLIPGTPNSSMTFVPDDAIPLWITMHSLHPALSDNAAAIQIGEDLTQLEDLPFYIEHRLGPQAYYLSH